MIHLIDETNNSEWADLCDLFYLGVEDDLSFYVEQSRKVGGSALVLGCSTGRVVNALAGSGKFTDGIDPSAAQIAKASNNIQEESRGKSNLIQDDLCDFEVNESNRYGIVVIPNYAFMSIISPDDQETFLKRINQILSNGGLLVLDMEVPDPSVMLCDPSILYHELDLDTQQDSSVTIYTQRDYDFFSQIGLLKIVAEHIDASGLVTKRTLHELGFRYTFRWEMFQLLKLCGFTSIRLFSDFNMESFDENSTKMVWVATNNN